MTKCKITLDMLDRLDYNAEAMKTAQANSSESPDCREWVAPTVMIVFARSDLNAALYHLAKSLETPFAPNSIATVLVEESIVEDFISKLRYKQLKPYGADVSQHPAFVRGLETIRHLQAKTVNSAEFDAAVSPTLVCDFSHEHLGAGVSGIATLHAFRTAKEAIALCKKESLRFANASIWNENHSCAYELVAATGCSNYYINCFRVALTPIEKQMAAGENFVAFDGRYHYETLPLEGVQKSIVFPVGTIFAN